MKNKVFNVSRILISFRLKKTLSKKTTKKNLIVLCVISIICVKIEWINNYHLLFFFS